MRVRAGSIQARPHPATVGCAVCWCKWLLLLCAAKHPTSPPSIAASAARRGHKRAIIAVAHRLLIAVYHMLRQHQPYRDYRTTIPGQYTEQQLVKKLQQRVERLGYQVQLVPIAASQIPS
jgi:hypothetical protein